MDIEDEYAEEIVKHIELEDLIAEQKEQLAQQNNLIAILIKSMLSEGKTLASISQTLNISETQISELLSK